MMIMLQLSKILAQSLSIHVCVYLIYDVLFQPNSHHHTYDVSQTIQREHISHRCRCRRYRRRYRRRHRYRRRYRRLHFRFMTEIVFL